MESSARLLVALVLVAAVASACGGREEDASATKAADAASAQGAPGSANAAKPGITNAEGQLNLTPEQAKKLSMLRADYVEKTPAKPAKAVVTRIESTDGSAIELPESFPPDIPIYPGSTPTHYIESAATGMMTVFETNETIEAARKYTATALTNEGWSITGDLSRNGMTMLTAEKDGRELSVAVVEDGGVTKITTLQN